MSYSTRLCGQQHSPRTLPAEGCVAAGQRGAGSVFPSVRFDLRVKWQGGKTPPRPVRSPPKDRVAPGGCPPGAPTDPNVRN